jgi:hypothetical protein
MSPTLLFHSILGFPMTSQKWQGVNSKTKHSYQSESIVRFMYWWQIRGISYHFLTPVQHKHRYIWGWPPVRFTTLCRSETQEYSVQYINFHLIISVPDSSTIIQLSEMATKCWYLSTNVFCHWMTVQYSPLKGALHSHFLVEKPP